MRSAWLAIFKHSRVVSIAQKILGTAHYLLGVRGWKYSIRDNFFCEGKHTGQKLFSIYIYGTKTFLTETENDQGIVDSWRLYLPRKNDTLPTILLKPRFYATVVVSKCW